MRLHVYVRRPQEDVDAHTAGAADGRSQFGMADAVGNVWQYTDSWADTHTRAVQVRVLSQFLHVCVLTSGLCIFSNRVRGAVARLEQLVPTHIKGAAGHVVLSAGTAAGPAREVLFDGRGI